MSQLSLLLDKINSISKQVEQSAANHHFMLGSLSALKSVYDEMKEYAPEVANIAAMVGEIIPQALPVTEIIEQAASDVEHA